MTLVREGVIDGPTATRIRAWTVEQGEAASGREPTPDSPRSSFDLSHSAYYLGALVIMFALGWFAIESWERYGPGRWRAWRWLTRRCSSCSAKRCGAAVGGYRGGLLFSAAVGMAPLLAFAVQAGLGVWPEGGHGTSSAYYAAVNGHTIAIALTTVAAALVAMRLRPFAFLLVGLLLMGAGYLLDHRTREDYAFWLYLAGLLAFFFPAFEHFRESLGFGLTRLFFMMVAVLIRRRVFAVFGGVGVFSYLVYQSADLFRESLLFPVALSAVGLTLILGGVAYTRPEDRIRG